MKKINKAAEELLKKLELKERVEENKAVEIWAEVVGPVIANRTKAISARKGVLKVMVESSSWSQELSLLKNRIIENINTESRNSKITDIKFVLGQIPREKKRSILEDIQPGLSEKEIELIKNIIDNIEDQNLKDKLARAVKSSCLTQKRRKTL